MNHLEKTIFFTGATSGLGKVAACTLANLGNKVIATARNEQRGQQLLDYYNANFPNSKGSIEILECDLSSFESIVRASEIFNATHSSLDILINNAGIMNFDRKVSQNNIEETFHVNTLAPLLLIHLLSGKLLNSGKSKVITTSSSLHYGKINFDDIELKDHYRGFNAYRQSKLSVILLIRLLAQKLHGKDLGIYSLHPGFVSTDLSRQSNTLFQLLFKLMGTSPEKGAQTLIYLATAPKEYLVSGEYYSKKKVTRSKPHSNDMEMAEKLYGIVNAYLSKYIYSFL